MPVPETEAPDERRGRGSFLPRWLRWPLGLALIVIVGLATCGVGVEPSELLAEYGEPVPVSPEAASSIVARGADALRESAPDRAVRLELSEVEVTSVLALGIMLPELARAMRSVPADAVRDAANVGELRDLLLQRLSEGLDVEPAPAGIRDRLVRVLDPELRLLDGQARFTAGGEVAVAGRLGLWRARLPVLVVAAPHVESGEIEVGVRRLRVGRLPLPRWLAGRVGRAVSAAVAALGDGIDVTSITVSDEELVVEATVGSRPVG